MYSKTYLFSEHAPYTLSLNIKGFLLIGRTWKKPRTLFLVVRGAQYPCQSFYHRAWCIPWSRKTHKLNVIGNFLLLHYSLFPCWVFLKQMQFFLLEEGKKRINFLQREKKKKNSRAKRIKDNRVEEVEIWCPKKKV